MSSTFIVLEGPEGCGKSTQARMLADRLRALGHDVLLTHEPGGTPVGEAIRQIVLSPASGQIPPAAELMLMEASRAQHVAELIAPALAEGRTVICDRFSASTFAYQAVAGEVGAETFEAAEAASVGTVVPDITIIIDVPPEVGMQRRLSDRQATEGGDRMEQKDLGFHRRVRQGYLAYAARHADRCVVIDGQDSPEAVAEKVYESLVPYFPALRCHLRR